jgi:hypothetical protein
MLYTERASDPDHAKDLLEGLAEGIVRANIATIERSPEDFPCCCGCGDFKLVPTRVLPATLAPDLLKVRGPKGLCTAKQGNAFELACFQCAQRRRDGDEGATVEVAIDDDGMLCGYVIRTDGKDDEDMIKYLPAPERNCGDCGCSQEESV